MTFMADQSVVIRRLAEGDVPTFRKLNRLFADCFEDRETYVNSAPPDAYLADLLQNETIIPIVALVGNKVVGGLVAYELEKFEQARREIYIYDLAVDARFRRQGIATCMIDQVRTIASERQAWVIYVQADYVDEPAVALYTKLGRREDVLHFDIEP
ncbi:MAG: AAC(3)-I family aminoglycoside N-acetyltransferase [Pseudomonadota bacterium]